MKTVFKLMCLMMTLVLWSCDQTTLEWDDLTDEEKSSLTIAETIERDAFNCSTSFEDEYSRNFLGIKFDTPTKMVSYDLNYIGLCLRASGIDSEFLDVDELVKYEINHESFNVNVNVLIQNFEIGDSKWSLFYLNLPLLNTSLATLVKQDTLDNCLQHFAEQNPQFPKEAVFASNFVPLLYTDLFDNVFVFETVTRGDKKYRIMVRGSVKKNQLTEEETIAD